MTAPWLSGPAAAPGPYVTRGPHALPLGVTLLRCGDRSGPTGACAEDAGGCPAPSSQTHQSPGAARLPPVGTKTARRRAGCSIPPCPLLLDVRQAAWLCLVVLAHRPCPRCSVPVPGAASQRPSLGRALAAACPAALGFTGSATPTLFITGRLWRVNVPHSAALAMGRACPGPPALMPALPPRTQLSFGVPHPLFFFAHPFFGGLLQHFVGVLG